MSSHRRPSFHSSLGRAIRVGSLLLATGLATAEVETLLGPPDDLLLAGTRPNPEEIGPAIRHHHPHEDGLQLELEVSAGVDSRYVSEGRDNLPGQGGILWGTATGHLHALGGSIFGEVLGLTGWEASYQEFVLTGGYEYESGPLTLGASVSYLRFPSDDQDDVEFALSSRLIFDSGIGFSAEAVWSVEAEGWFGEAKVFCEVPAGQQVTLVPALFLGANQGYVPGEHDGFNHLGVRLSGILSVTEQLEVSLYAAFLEPLSQERDDSLRDLFWMGTALTATF